MTITEYFDLCNEIRKAYQKSYDGAAVAYRTQLDKSFARERQSVEELLTQNKADHARIEAVYPDRFKDTVQDYEAAVANAEADYACQIKVAETHRREALLRAALKKQRDETFARMVKERDEKLAEAERQWAQAREAEREQRQKEWEKEREKQRQEHEQRWREFDEKMNDLKSKFRSQEPTGDAREIWTAFHRRFHPDKHQGKAYLAQLTRIAQDVNATYDRKPYDVIQKLQTLTAQAETLVG